MHAAVEADQDPESAPHGHALMGSYLSSVSPTLSGSIASPYSTSTYASSFVNPTTGMDQRTLEVLLNLNFQTNNGEYLNTMGGQIYGAITTLDAWNLVCAHTKFGKFDVEALAHRLAPKVECKGYGPTVDAEEVFKAVEEVMSGQAYGRI